jgi:D-aspartate ligase
LNTNGQSNGHGIAASGVSPDTGALVIGGDYQGLGVVRSLGRQGVSVGILDDEASIARYSSYTTFSERIPSLKDPEETFRALIDLAKKRNLCGWVLYPTRDETVVALSRYRKELCEWYRVPTPPEDTIQWFWDKRKTYELASRLCIPAPRTWLVRDLKDLDQIEGCFPVALKPAIKEHFIYVTRAKAWRANNSTELRDLFKQASKFMPPGEIMIQDIVPGNGTHQYSYCCFFRQGKAVASLVTRRLRQHPLEFGRASTYVESVDLPYLEEISQRFLRATNYYGLVEMEYKQDPRDGQYRLLDANARTWGYNSIGRAAGVDFPSLIFFDQLEKPVAECRGKTGIHWVRLLTDLPTGAVAIAKGDLKWLEYINTLWEVDEEAVFTADDPLPGLVEFALAPYLLCKRGF